MRIKARLLGKPQPAGLTLGLTPGLGNLDAWSVRPQSPRCGGTPALCSPASPEPPEPSQAGLALAPIGVRTGSRELLCGCQGPPHLAVLSPRAHPGGARAAPTLAGRASA